MIKALQNILLIGPKRNKQKKNIGGATLSFGYLINYFEDNRIPYNLISTQHFDNKLKGFINPLYILLLFSIQIWKSKLVFVNVSQKGIKYLCPIIFIISKLLRKKVIIRPFGGAMKDYYLRYNTLQKFLFHKTILKSDIFYLQTEELVNYFLPIGRNVKQLKTSRQSPDRQFIRGDRPYQKRFLFLGHIKESKGIDIILDAIGQLDDSFTIDIFGSIVESKYQYLESEAYPFYKGLLKKKEILSTMQAYDILLLPTFYEGEGYPGVLIEAYSIGLPVITTRWNSIPELVKQNETGILIKPKSTESLIKAIESIGREGYKKMSKNAIDYFETNFESDNINSALIKELMEL